MFRGRSRLSLIVQCSTTLCHIGSCLIICINTHVQATWRSRPSAASCSRRPPAPPYSMPSEGWALSRFQSLPQCLNLWLGSIYLLGNVFTRLLPTRCLTLATNSTQPHIGTTTAQHHTRILLYATCVHVSRYIPRLVPRTLPMLTSLHLLCCAVLCSAVLCCAALCCAVLWYAVL